MSNMHLPACFSLSSLPSLPPLPPLPSLSSLRSSLASLPSLDELYQLSTTVSSLRQHPKMLSIATLFDDEQRLLNRVWVVLLGLQALLVLFGTISAVVRGVVAMRRSSSFDSMDNAGLITNTDFKNITNLTNARRGGLRRAGASPLQYPRHVTIELPATVYEYSEHSEKSGYDYHYDYDAYDDGYAEAYSNTVNYDEYEYSEKYARFARAGTPAHILNSPSQKV